MDVFISYRREGGFVLARLLYEWFNKEKISAFLDLEELSSGPFNEKLYSAIEAADNFVLILPPNALDRCTQEDDWLRLEIEHAIEHKKNIIPLLANGFVFPQELPPSLQSLPYFNGVQMSREYFDAAMTKLVSMLVGLKPKDQRASFDKHEDVRYYLDEDEAEKHRLRTEDDLLDRYEAPVVKKLLEGKENVVCLDVNVLNARRALKHLEYPEISKVIALTYNEDILRDGNREKQSDDVGFFQVTFEADDLERQLERCLDAMGVDGVDFVCMRMALLDFKKPFKVLEAIRNVLNDDAVMIVIDVDDGAVFAYPDPHEHFKTIQTFYSQDKYAGFRYMGRQVYSYLRKIDPKSVKLELFGINTSDMSRKDKKALFECWFSFIPNDFARIAREEPGSEIAQKALAFCNEHYDEINEAFFSADTLFSSGYVIYSVRF